MENHDHSAMQKANGHVNHYRKLLFMTILSFVAMYVLMYAMVDTWDNVVPNINQLYMAGLMTAAMVIIEMVIMGGMYTNKRLNTGLMVLSVIALAGFYMGIRNQAAVSDKEFLKSMIPHHAGAVLMSGKTTLKDPEIRKLQQKIIESQEAEIRFMKAKLAELDKK